MTLEELIKKIGEMAIQNSLVSWYGGGGSIYELNNLTIKDYSLIYVSPTGTHTATNNYTQFNLTIFYMDRLIDDNSNDVQVFSTGVEVLKNIIRGLMSIDGVLGISDTYTIQNFTETEKMSDKCGGAYATLDIMVADNGVCYID